MSKNKQDTFEVVFEKDDDRSIVKGVIATAAAVTVLVGGVTLAYFLTKGTKVVDEIEDTEE